ncbi:hypothetical protein [Thalassomonas sp. M1454]|uniref:hypothetical protein n=1 Tax=Thalassomonas sp. M1454 TaxID=2594477 RepID=UPI0011804435|nr:hypothetical protein [Thalassomonas sp. M1454]TRX53943.1 hypothetical protein FNN08_13400 [Thalassomonas sp. M1454]
MNYNTTKKPKLSIMSKALGLALLLPLSANAALDSNFPVLEGAYLNHINETGNPGKNLIVNPTLDLCIKNVDAEVWTPNPDADCSAYSNPVYGWGWTGANKGGTGKAVGDRYTPILGGGPISDDGVAHKNLARGDKNNGVLKLASPIAVSGVSKVYVYFEGQPQGLGGSIQLDLDGTIHIVEADLIKDGTWGPFGYVVDLSESVSVPYTGSIDLQFIANGTTNADKIVADNIFLSTDTILFPDVDTDKDGLSDDDENDIYGTDPNLADTDGDNLSDGDEVNVHGTNPLLKDSDNDGTDDDVELAEGTDPTDPASFPGDVDGDGVPDSIDDYKTDPSASLDSDGDSYPDQLNPVNEACDQACLDASELVVDAFPDSAAAFADMDEDGEPDSFITAECKVGGVIEGENLAECDGLTLDLDRDGDGDLNEDEIAQGSNPNNPDSNSLDLDGDGWANDIDGKELLSSYHLSTNTNIIASYSPDAETAILVNERATVDVNQKWETWGSTATDNDPNHFSIVDTTDYEGAPTKAFKLSSASTTYDKNNSSKLGTLQLRSRKIAPLATNITRGRIGARLNISSTNDVDLLDTKVGVRIVATSESNGTSYVGAFITVTAEDIAEYNAKGWFYAENDFVTKGPIKDLQVQMTTDTTNGIEVLFDDVELNLITPSDTDLDGIDDSIDLNDDGDEENDGVDLTPLGPDAKDSDGDMIPDAYDDDLDNDSIANPFDANFNPILSEAVETKTDTESMIEVTAFDADEDNVTYIWTLAGTELAESGNKISVNYADQLPGVTIPVTVKATDGTDESATQTIFVTIPGVAEDYAPTINDSMVATDHILGTHTITADYFDNNAEDTLSHTWTVNGVETADLDGTLVINDSDFAVPGTVVTVVLTVTDGKLTSEKSWTVTTNQVAVLNVEKTILNDDETLYSVGYFVDDNLVLGVQDVDGDFFTYSWKIAVNGVDTPFEDGEYTSKELVINRFDYPADSVLTITVTAVDINRPEQAAHTVSEVITLELPAIEGKNDDEIYPKGGDGGAMWWMMALLIPAFIRRRISK